MTIITLPDGRQMTVPAIQFPPTSFDMPGRGPGPRRGDSARQGQSATTAVPPKKPPPV
jgi:hypothetical protein